MFPSDRHTQAAGVRANAPRRDRPMTDVRKEPEWKRLEIVTAWSVIPLGPASEQRTRSRAPRGRTTVVLSGCEVVSDSLGRERRGEISQPSITGRLEAPDRGKGVAHRAVEGRLAVLFHHVDEQLVHSRVVGQFRVKRRGKHVALADGHGSSVFQACKHFDAVAD